MGLLRAFFGALALSAAAAATKRLDLEAIGAALVQSWLFWSVAGFATLVMLMFKAADGYIKTREWIEKLHKYTADLPALLTKINRSLFRRRIEEAFVPVLLADNDADPHLDPEPDPNGDGNGRGIGLNWRQVTRRRPDGSPVNWKIADGGRVKDLLAWLLRLLLGARYQFGAGQRALGRAAWLAVALGNVMLGGQAMAATFRSLSGDHILRRGGVADLVRGDVVDRNGLPLARTIDAYALGMDIVAAESGEAVRQVRLLRRAVLAKTLLAAPLPLVVVDGNIGNNGGDALAFEQLNHRYFAKAAGKTGTADADRRELLTVVAFHSLEDRLSNGRSVNDGTVNGVGSARMILAIEPLAGQGVYAEAEADQIVIVRVRFALPSPILPYV